MHEFAITQQVLEIALDAAAAHSRDGGAGRLAAIHVAIGALTGISEESMRFYFDVLAQNSAAGGVTLIVERRDAVAHCRACGWSAAVAPPLDPACPRCGAWGIEVEGGRDLVVERVELVDETAEEVPA